MSWVVQCDLWLPLRLSQHLGQAPLPMATWFAWHFANRAAIAQSKFSTDNPFAEPTP